MSNSLQPYGPEPARLLCPWDSPGKNTGVGCHALLQGIFPTQGSNPYLQHYRRILYCWVTRKAHNQGYLCFIYWHFLKRALSLLPIFSYLLSMLTSNNQKQTQLSLAMTKCHLLKCGGCHRSPDTPLNPGTGQKMLYLTWNLTRIHISGWGWPSVKSFVVENQLGMICVFLVRWVFSQLLAGDGGCCPRNASCEKETAILETFTLL